MSRAVLTMHGLLDRQRAKEWIDRAPPRTRVEFKGPTRSLDQNSKMWAMLTEIACQITWHGLKLKPTDWKDMFTASLRKARVVPNLEGDGFVALGLRTSDMSKAELSDMIELIAAWGAQNDVRFAADAIEPGTAVQHAGRAA